MTIGSQGSRRGKHGAKPRPSEVLHVLNLRHDDEVELQTLHLCQQPLLSTTAGIYVSISGSHRVTPILCVYQESK
jgi:hypothetical protein